MPKKNNKDDIDNNQEIKKIKKQQFVRSITVRQKKRWIKKRRH